MLRASRRLLPLRGSPFSSLQSPVPAQARAGANWDASVTSELVSGLLRDGYYVVRDAFPVEYLRRLRDEMKLLHTSDQLYPNSTHILLSNVDNGSKSTTKTLLLEKHDIFETELALDAIRYQSTVPFLRDFFEQQVVFGPLHLALPNWLGLAAVLYLNEEWKQGDGGEIVLYPFPNSRVVVQPRFGELVLFSSQRMLHRVMPANKPRYALTTWMYHSPPHHAKAESAAYYQNVVSEQTSDVDNATFRGMVTKVLRSPFRRHLVKLAYKDAWAQSLHGSHLQTEAFDHYMATHQKELQVIEAATVQMLGNFRAKDGGANSKLPQTSEELMQRMEDPSNREFVQNLQLQWF
ncbi:hypothetical protein PI125_g10465 [Phytophthora idaei]|nr:hypothetical protein PI125_g10465 [Phytophthora idaei]